MRLWDLDDRVRELERVLSELEEDGQDEAILAAFATELDGAREDLSGKLDGIAALITSLAATAKARREEADRLTRLARSDEARADRLRVFLSDYLRLRGIDRIDTPRYRLTFAKNGGLAPLRVDLPPEELPDEYVRAKLSPDNEAIREALARGEELPWARLDERETVLRIR